MDDLDHLKYLYGKLDEMKELDEKLSKAMEAADLIHKKESIEGAKIEYQRAKKELSSVEQQLEDAQSNGASENDLDQIKKKIEFWGSQCGFHSSPAKFGDYQYRDEIRKSSFSTEEEIEKAFLPAEERAKIQSQIDQYKDDYLKTVSKVQSQAQVL